MCNGIQEDKRKNRGEKNTQKKMSANLPKFLKNMKFSELQEG